MLADEALAESEECLNKANVRISILQERLGRIEAMARRHASPSSNPGAHALAAAIVRICEEK